MTTIRELARRCGVSVATVSRVFNNYPDVSEKTRARVLEIARELDYTPTAAARTLVTRRSYLIGAVLSTRTRAPELKHPFFQDVLVGLKHRVGELGYDLLIVSSESENGSGEVGYLRRCRHHHVDGVVVWGLDERDPELQKLVRSRIPCIGVDLPALGLRTGNVMSDNVDGAEKAVDHLHGIGYDRIAFVSGLLTTSPGVDRLVGYRRALERLGLPYRDEYVEEGDFYLESGYAAMQRLLDLSEPPEAVFASSDLMAVGAIRAAQDRGLRVPHDVAVVGFDDVQIAPLVQPALTTIRQDKEGLGAAAGEALIRMIEDPTASPPAVTLPVELVVRDSCGARIGAAGSRLRKEVA
jgi:LacI family transcriptional regulator